MALSSFSFDDARLERRDGAFVLKTGGATNIRLHAYGRATEAAAGAGSSPFVAFYSTDRRRWLPPATISAVQEDSAQLRGLVDHVFPVSLDVLSAETAMQCVVRRCMSRMGFLIPDMIDGCARSVSAFSQEAARVAESAGCKARLVLLVEISLFRVYEDNVPPPRPSPTSWMMSAVQSVELHRGDEVAAASCAICLEDLSLGKRVVRMRCRHVYHRACLLRWLRRAPFCPLCRRPAAEQKS